MPGPIQLGSRISVWDKYDWSWRTGGFLDITLVWVLLPALAAQMLPHAMGLFTALPEDTGPFAGSARPQHWCGW